MYKLWGQSSCSVHSHNIIKQYMDTVAYMVLHAQDTLPDLSVSALGDNHYLPNTLQGHSKLFQCGGQVIASEAILGVTNHAVQALSQ